MATIVKRRNGTFQARIRVRGAKPISETFSSKSKAERWALSAEAAVKDGRRIPSVEAKKHTMADLIDRYI
ncbi:MAG: site-specific integrase, partial [SAR324 cluster bacterium]|nr:site-specific integrase [SAR324 cluster bacterium]